MKNFGDLVQQQWIALVLLVVHGAAANEIVYTLSGYGQLVTSSTLRQVVY